jgi:hypothetical protein
MTAFVPPDFTPPAGLIEPAFHLLPLLHAAAGAWLRDAWPFERIDYAARPAS